MLRLLKRLFGFGPRTVDQAIKPLLGMIEDLTEVTNELVVQITDNQKQIDRLMDENEEYVVEKDRAYVLSNNLRNVLGVTEDDDDASN